MISFIFHVISIFYIVAAAAGNSKDVNVEGIVNDLVENWEPPISYLKSRGYLPGDLPSAPGVQDFQQLLQGNSGQDRPVEKDSKRGLDRKGNKCGPRTSRSEQQDLRNMFRSKKPLAHGHQHKELAEDALLKQAVPYDGPKFPNDLPKVLKRLAMWRPKRESKPENQAKYF